MTNFVQKIHVKFRSLRDLLRSPLASDMILPRHAHPRASVNLGPDPAPREPSASVKHAVRSFPESNNDLVRRLRFVGLA